MLINFYKLLLFLLLFTKQVHCSAKSSWCGMTIYFDLWNEMVDPYMIYLKPFSFQLFFPGYIKIIFPNLRSLFCVILLGLSFINMAQVCVYFIIRCMYVCIYFTIRWVYLCILKTYSLAKIIPYGVILL